MGASLWLLGGCASNSGEGADLAGAYALIIEWFAGQASPESDQPVVFVVAQGEGFEIELALQAGVVSDTDGEVDVRFVDDQSEAIDDDGVVRDEGRLIAVGPAVTEGAEVIIDSDELIGGDVSSWRFALRMDGDEWSFVRAPSPLDS